MITETRDFRKIGKFTPWKTNLSPLVRYVMDIKDGQDRGIWAFEPYLDGMLIHGCTNLKGLDVKISVRQALKWAFETLDCSVIYSVAEKGRQDIQVMSIAAGGRRSHTKGDNVYFKIEAEDMSCTRKVFDHGR
ncbi:MAG: hypothetical protein V7723_07550 [Sneathiella sp.]|uniref:hypothetical protein n=1 Tax=Sneathiella sp. TaxID=1964365 RepID=UPI00300374E2